MKLRIEREGRNKITIHVDVDLFTFCPDKEPDKWIEEDDDDFCHCDDGESPFFRNRLLLMKGVTEVSFDRYSLEVEKGDIFSWKQLIPQLVEELETTLNKGGKSKRIYIRGRKSKAS